MTPVHLIVIGFGLALLSFLLGLFNFYRTATRGEISPGFFRLHMVAMAGMALGGAAGLGGLAWFAALLFL